MSALVAAMNEPNFKREIINPMDTIKAWWPNADISHITYDPNFRSKDREYWRIEQCGHDGTAYFSYEMMSKALLPIINMTTFFKGTAPEDWSKVKRIEYIIGPMKIATVYGMIELKCGRYPGMRERVRYPVRCKYIYE